MCYTSTLVIIIIIIIINEKINVAFSCRLGVGSYHA